MSGEEWRADQCSPESGPMSGPECGPTGVFQLVNDERPVLVSEQVLCQEKSGVLISVAPSLAPSVALSLARLACFSW